MMNMKANLASNLGGAVSNFLQHFRGARLFIKKFLETSDAHIKVGREWLTVEEYREKYVKEFRCEGAQRMPCADDTTPADCEKCKGGNCL